MRKVQTAEPLFIYLFGANLLKHVDLYLNWIEAADSRPNGLKILPLTSISFGILSSQRKQIDYYRKRGVKILITPPLMSNVAITIFLVINAMKFKRVFVHLRKRSHVPVWLASLITPSRIKCVVELEGLESSERDYLERMKGKKTKLEIFQGKIAGFVQSVKHRNTLRFSDGLITGSDELRTLLADSGYSKPIEVFPTGFSSDFFFFDQDLRQKVREKNGWKDNYVFVFSGGTKPWQRLDKAVEIFSMVESKSLVEKPFFLLLLRETEQAPVRALLGERIHQKNIRIIDADFPEVNSYLNASDIGFLLRDPHPMNTYCSPAKGGEYLASGLPMITSKTVSVYAPIVLRHNLGVVFEDLDDRLEILRKLTSGLPQCNRGEIATQIARQNYDVSSHIDDYIFFLKDLSGMH